MNILFFNISKVIDKSTHQNWLKKDHVFIIFAQACERFSFFQLQNNVLNDYRNVVNYKVS